MTEDAILSAIARKAEVHPELRDLPIRWHGLEQILAREDIALFRVPLPRPAQLVPYGSSWSILLNSSLPPRRQTHFVVHELAHLWLHHDPHFGRWERVFNMDEEWGPDPREDDAEYFAACLLGGPRCF